jgi:hypothetical protein
MAKKLSMKKYLGDISMLYKRVLDSLRSLEQYCSSESEGRVEKKNYRYFFLCLSLRSLFFLLCLAIFFLFLFLPQGIAPSLLKLIYHFIQRIFYYPLRSVLFKPGDKVPHY